jgi:hypothetical protein
MGIGAMNAQGRAWWDVPVASLTVVTFLMLFPNIVSADQYIFTDSSQSIVRDGEEWRYVLPDIPRYNTYWIRFSIEVLNGREVDVRLVEYTNDTMEQQGRIERDTIYWRPDLRYVARYIVVTPTEDLPDSHNVVFAWELDIYSEVEEEEDEGASAWDRHGLLIMGSAALVAVILMLSIVLKAPGRGVEPDAHKDMGSLRFHHQKMR